MQNFESFNKIVPYFDARVIIKKKFIFFNFVIFLRFSRIFLNFDFCLQFWDFQEIL